MNSVPRLGIAQIIAHASLIPMLIWGQGFHYAISLFVYFMTMCFGMSMTFHRLISHDSWRAPQWFKAFGLFMGTYGLTGSSISWGAIHRQHHAYTDQDLDPHSPLKSHPLRVQFFSMLPKPKLVRFAKDLIKDPMQKFFHRNYWLIHLFVLVALLAVDPFAIVYAYLFPAAILWNAGSAINSIGHLVGYKNFETKDSGRNNLLLGYLTFGEGWHNNHHQQPRNPNFGQKPWELDLAGVLIRILQEKRT